MKKVLVLYAKSGFLGHTVIAMNYAALLRKNGYEVETGDLFAIEGKVEIKSGTKLYMWVIKNAPWIWRLLYIYWTYLPFAQYFKNNILPTRFPKTQKIIQDFGPDFIVTTHPTATGLVSFLKDKKIYNGPLFTTFSDWHVQDFHIYRNVSKYFLVVPEQKAYMIKKGWPENKLCVPGILVGENYYNTPTKSEAKQILNVEEGRKMILVMGGGRGWGLEKIIEHLAHLQVPAYVCIVAGSEEKKTELEKTTPANHPSVQFQVLPFVEEPSKLFAAADLLISKPGGLTSSQAFLLRTPLMALSPLPGQEDLNIQYLLPKGAIITLEKKENFLDKITSLLKNPKELIEVAENAYNISPKDAPGIVLAEIAKD